MKTPKEERKEQAENFPGYPPYPPAEDIYSAAKKEELEENEGDLDIEDTLTQEDEFNKLDDERRGLINPEIENDLDSQIYERELDGGELDIPGAELDDDMEELGSEDEENNYYSLGGDNHESLEEDNEPTR
ncbi:MAG TPA: hypothetical protein VEC12_05835 [Bacteroidia bacterium]|nr:hypothetical protein [Bacteroidia bacterium]